VSTRRARGISRRQFVKRAATIAGGALVFPQVVPSSALGLAGTVAPSNRISIGVIGTGRKGQGGMGNFLRCPGARVAAVCDVDSACRAQGAAMARLTAKDCHNDYRELIGRDDVDAVLIATPDHWHALQVIAAARAGKHIYCEKPLSNTIAEGRAMVDAVKRYGVVFQHGTQLRSVGGNRFACELLRNGRLGELKGITIGSPPGKATGMHPAEPVPDGFDYDLWLGPAPDAPYTRWRTMRVPEIGGLAGWYFISDYSLAGWVAGYAVHDIDLAHWGMDTERTGPVEIEGEGEFPKEGLYDTVLGYRLELTYANGIKVTITDTSRHPHGVTFYGTEGEVHFRGGIKQIKPKSLLKEVLAPRETHLYRSNLQEQNFLDCVRTRAQTITPVEVAHRSTSVTLLGGIALKLKRKVRWNPQRERFVDDPEADQLLTYTMRSPWSL